MDVLNSTAFTNTLSAFLKNNQSFVGDLPKLDTERHQNGMEFKMIFENALDQKFDISSMLKMSNNNNNNNNNGTLTSQSNRSSPQAPTTPTNKRIKTSNTNSKSGTKKSFVWKYFKHPLIDGAIDRTRTQCLLCDSQLAFNASGTTTTMLNHLKSRHGEIAETEENIRRVNRSFNQTPTAINGINMQMPQSETMKCKQNLITNAPFEGVDRKYQSKKQSKMAKTKVDLNETINRLNSAQITSNQNFMKTLTKNLTNSTTNQPIYPDQCMGQNNMLKKDNLFSNFSHENNSLAQNLLKMNESHGAGNNSENFLQTWLSNMNTINTTMNNNVVAAPSQKDPEFNYTNILNQILSPPMNPLFQNLPPLTTTANQASKPSLDVQTNANFLHHLMSFMPLKSSETILQNTGQLFGQLQNNQMHHDNAGPKPDPDADLSDSNTRTESIDECPSFKPSSSPASQDKMSTYKRKHSPNECNFYINKSKMELDEDSDPQQSREQNSTIPNSKRFKEKFDQENFYHSLAYFLVKDFNSPEIIEGSGFKKLWNFHLPNSMKIRNKYMPELENSIRIKMLKKFASQVDAVKTISLLVDVWELASEQEDSYFSIGFRVNYHNSNCDEFLWKTQNINTVDCDKINEFIGSCLDDISFGELNQELTVVTTNRPVLITEAIKKSDSLKEKSHFIVLPCVLSLLNESVTETIAELKLANVWSVLEKNLLKKNSASSRRERRTSQLSGDSENSSSVQSVDSNIEFQDGNNNSAGKDHSTESFLSNSFNLNETLKTINSLTDKTETNIFNTNDLIRIIKNVDSIRRYILANRYQSVSHLINFILKKLTCEIDDGQENGYSTIIYEIINKKIMEGFKTSPDCTLFIDQSFFLNPTIKSSFHPANKKITYATLKNMISNVEELEHYMTDDSDLNTLPNGQIHFLSDKYKSLANPISNVLSNSSDLGDYEFFQRKRRCLDSKDVEIYTFLNRNWHFTY